MTGFAVTQESDQARAWRESWGLTQEELGALTGYSREAVWWMEAGRPPTGGPYATHNPRNLRRYRLCCAAVEQQLRTGRVFAWEPKGE